MGSARVPRASSGVAPELWSPTISGISGGKKFAGRDFRRDAENHPPEAYAPQQPRPEREPGRLAAGGHGNGGGRTQGQLNLPRGLRMETVRAPVKGAFPPSPWLVKGIIPFFLIFVVDRKVIVR